ncbi:hypothetical protein BDZ89DRAFT_1170738 [Hymenopellis radicata]|nr:hypothetical protein BDZ89DRAFT_1170738 [Hymenopellis radicata]
MAPTQTSATEIMGSGLSQIALLVFLFLSMTYFVYFFLISRFWPGSIIFSTSKRRGKALDRFANSRPIDLGSRQRALFDQIAPESHLADKISKLQTRYDQAWDDGVLTFVGEFNTLYNEACALEADMDGIEIELDQLLPASTLG